MSVLSPTPGASAAKIRVAVNPPTHCSSCFTQDPSKLHVDFGAAWDGPTFRDDVAGAPLVVTVDDLVVCEDCLATAALLLPGDKTAALVAGLEEENVGLRERLEGALRYIAKLEEAAEAKEAFDKVRPRQPKKPKTKAEVA
jgi:hypothetical protein